MSVLRACPWCNRAPNPVPQNTDTRRENGDGYTVAIWCEPCGVLGPECETEPEAIAAWNRRAPDYTAGAEAMREAAAKEAEAQHEALVFNVDQFKVKPCTVFVPVHRDAASAASAIRALPLPEPPK